MQFACVNVSMARHEFPSRLTIGRMIMAIYQSMQRVRFRTASDYEQFKLVFAGVRHHLKSLPGFLHLTWWTHPDDPTWHNEVSFWTSFEALKDWHMNTYHKHAKQWAVRTGAIIEDIIVNFELKSTRLIRVCPCCVGMQRISLTICTRSRRASHSHARSAAFTSQSCLKRPTA